MEFFTAGDILDHATAATPEEPVTVRPEASIQDALELMLTRSFDQLPVVGDDRVEGAVTYESVAKYVKAIDDPAVGATSVAIALDRSPEFVDPDHDIFELFETFATDDFVLVGDRDELAGILTRYDVFYFLEDQVEPFLKIGEIEEALRRLFRECCDDLEGRIEATFADRAEHDESFEIPEGVERFSFDDYRLFVVRNLDALPPRIAEERDTVETLLEDLRDTRNALFHFRAGADEIDRDQLDVGHAYFTGIAGVE